MNTIQRFVLLPFGLCWFVALPVAAADIEIQKITATPAVFLREEHNRSGAISPDGKYIAYQTRGTRASPRQQFIVDATTKKILQTIPMAFQGGVFTPNSSRFVCLRNLRGERPRGPSTLKEVDVHDVKTGKLLREIALRPGQPGGGGDSGGNTPAFVISNDLLVVSGTNEVATIYELATGKLVGDLPGTHRVRWLALSRDGCWLLTLDNKGGLRSWDVKKCKHDRLVHEYVGKVEAIAISADGRWCAAATKDCSYQVFDRTTGATKADVCWRCRDKTNAIEFTTDGKRLVSYGPYLVLQRSGGKQTAEKDWGLCFWDWQTTERPTSVISPSTPEALKGWDGMGKFHPRLMTSDGNRFLSVGGGHGMLLLDLKNPNPPPEKKPEEPKAKK